MPSVFDTLQTLWENSSAINNSQSELSHYAHFALKNSLSNFRVIKTSQVWKLGEQVPSHISKFIAERGQVFGIFEFFDAERTRPVFVILRDMESKEFRIFGHNSGLFYGYSSLISAYSSKPLVLVEGALDCEVCKQFYPNCMAILTARLSKPQIELLKQVANSIVLFYDNDISGLESIANDFPLLKLQGFEVSSFQTPSPYKDAGELPFYEWSLDNKKDLLFNFLKTKLNF